MRTCRHPDNLTLAYNHPSVRGGHLGKCLVFVSGILCYCCVDPIKCDQSVSIPLHRLLIVK